MGIGDWGLGIGDWGLGPIPNPQSPIPNPQKYDFKKIIRLSKILDDYITPSELLKDEKDHLERNIIKNKYKIYNIK